MCDSLHWQPTDEQLRTLDVMISQREVTITLREPVVRRVDAYTERTNTPRAIEFLGGVPATFEENIASLIEQALEINEEEYGLVACLDGRVVKLTLSMRWKRLKRRLRYWIKSPFWRLRWWYRDKFGRRAAKMD